MVCKLLEVRNFPAFLHYHQADREQHFPFHPEEVRKRVSRIRAFTSMHLLINWLLKYTCPISKILQPNPIVVAVVPSNQF